MKCLKILLLCGALLIAGCSAKSLNPGAKSVIISPNKPNNSCTYIGPVHGNQVDW